MERGQETIFGGLPCRHSLSPRVSPSRAPIFSCAHYFQAPATQANLILTRFVYLQNNPDIVSLTLRIKKVLVTLQWESTSIMFRLTGAVCTQVMNNVVNGVMHSVMNQHPLQQRSSNTNSFIFSLIKAGIAHVIITTDLKNKSVL